MTRKACTFKQQDVTRVLRATIAAGVGVQRIEVGKDGKIVVVITGKPADGQASNEWDEVYHGEDKTTARK